MLALLNEETGHKEVEKVLKHSVMSSVNFAEVISVLIDIGFESSDAESLVSDLLQEIIPFDQQQALTAATLRQQMKQFG